MIRFVVHHFVLHRLFSFFCVCLVSLRGVSGPARRPNTTAVKAFVASGILTDESLGATANLAVTSEYRITQRSKVAGPVPEVYRMASQLPRGRRFPSKPGSVAAPFGPEDFAEEVLFVRLRS
jgi:hypothetical protein